jgi:hypothetical protein
VSVAIHTDISAYDGEDLTLVYTVFKKPATAGLPEDVSTWQITFTVTAADSNVVTYTVGSGVVLSRPASGEVTVELSLADNHMTPAVYNAALRRTSPGNALLAYGKITVQSVPPQ